MSITVTKWTINPKTQTRTMINKESSIETLTGFDGVFFVVGRTTMGARYYSETVDNPKEAYHIFRLYKDMISYFGGGEVQIFCVHDGGYDVVEFSKV